MKFFKLIMSLCIYLFLIVTIKAQNINPVVSNVTFSQRTDGSFIVDIYYDVNDADGNSMTVTMQASNDSGATWIFSCEQITGDVGAGITSGTSKHIVWDFGAEHPVTYGEQFQIKIIADDGVSVGGGVSCPGIPTVTYEGKTYHTILIGSQCWLKENLDVGTMLNSNTSGDNQTNNGVKEKYCYDNNPANCTTYGGFYQWDEAMQYSTTQGTRGICPSGWHIPTYAELQTLESFVNDEAKKLLEIGESGSATNETGFSALLSGYRGSNGNFYNTGTETFFWSSTQSSTFSSYYLKIINNLSDIELNYFYKEYGYSVRCLKD
ncbi:FISUMP domain-containing protein [Bacteroidota bacterium]